MILTKLPAEAREVGSQPMRCDPCGHHYSLPLYEMPDGPILSLARCPRCRDVGHQIPEGVAL